MPSLILNPYNNSPDPLVRVQTWVSSSDRDALHGVSTVRGFESFAIALYYQSLANVISEHKLSFTDRQQFHDFVLSLPAIIRAAGERHFSHVAGGVKPPHKRLPSTPNLPSDNGEVSSSGRRGRTRKASQSRQKADENISRSGQ